MRKGGEQGGFIVCRVDRRGTTCVNTVNTRTRSRLRRQKRGRNEQNTGDWGVGEYALDVGCMGFSGFSVCFCAFVRWVNQTMQQNKRGCEEPEKGRREGEESDVQQH